MNLKLNLLLKSLAAARSLKQKISPILDYHPSGTHLCDFDGFKLMLDFSKPGHKAIYRQGEFEPEVTSILAKLIRPGESFVDIGANIGWHTISVLTKRPDLLISY